MLKIGEFSQLSQVTVKTLRHYDDLGLIRPVHIDPSTNYRYYTVEQLPRIHRIMALKEIGLSLAQIGSMVNEDLPTEQLRGMLRLKQFEIEQQMQEAKKQMAMVEFRLRMIEAEAKFPVLDVVMKTLEPLFVLSLVVQKHHTIKSVATAFQSALRDGLIQHTGVVIDVFYGETIIPLESPEVREGQYEILFGVEPAQEPVTLSEIGELRPRLEPGIATAATLMLRGGDEAAAFERVALLQRWAVANGYRLLGRVRYWNHRGPLQTLNRNECVIEAQLPVETGD
jgi:DNA-binding transcriptional MerR regulator